MASYDHTLEDEPEIAHYAELFLKKHEALMTSSKKYEAFQAALGSIVEKDDAKGLRVALASQEPSEDLEGWRFDQLFFNNFNLVCQMVVRGRAEKCAKIVCQQECMSWGIFKRNFVDGPFDLKTILSGGRYPSFLLAELMHSLPNPVFHEYSKTILGYREVPKKSEGALFRSAALGGYDSLKLLRDQGYTLPATKAFRSLVIEKANDATFQLLTENGMEYTQTELGKVIISGNDIVKHHYKLAETPVLDNAVLKGDFNYARVLLGRGGTVSDYAYKKAASTQEAFKFLLDEATDQAPKDIVNYTVRSRSWSKTAMALDKGFSPHPNDLTLALDSCGISQYHTCPVGVMQKLLESPLTKLRREDLSLLLLLEQKYHLLVEGFLGKGVMADEGCLQLAVNSNSVAATKAILDAGIGVNDIDINNSSSEIRALIQSKYLSVWDLLE